MATAKQRGQWTLHSYSIIARGETDPDDTETQAIDCLTDLFTYLEDLEGVDLTKIVQTAFNHLEAE